jgi:hypothetical protein
MEVVYQAGMWRNAKHWKQRVRGEGVFNARVEWFIPNVHTFTLVGK